MKAVLKFILFALCFVGTSRFCYKQTQGFQLCKILSHLPYAQERDVPNSAEDRKNALSLLDQKFSFFMKGTQAYAFISEDKSTVLKLFKHNKMNPNHWNQKLPKALTFLIPTGFKHPQKHLREFFTSCIIANNLLKEETGVIFSHLTKTESLHHKIILVDLLNIEYELDADRVEFILQKKGVLCYEHLESLIATNQIDRAKKCIDSLISFVQKKNAMNVYDRDPFYEHNLAFIDDIAVHIDVGSFSLNSSDSPIRRDFIELAKLGEWLETKESLLADYLKSKVDAEFYLELK